MLAQHAKNVARVPCRSPQQSETTITRLYLMSETNDGVSVNTEGGDLVTWSIPNVRFKDQLVGQTHDLPLKFYGIALSRFDRELLVPRVCENDTCTRSVELLRCSGCKMAWYCSKRCQKKAWKRTHQDVCKWLCA